MEISRKDRTVAYWLLIGVGMIIVQTLLGGITRLSGSGLSITEWDIVTGTLPPLNHNAWLAEFEKYKQSPQFQYLNFDFTLSDFKSIFFWEWFHRFWARLMGLVFAIPFIYFIVKGYFKRSMLYPLVLLFVLGALQGAVGWIMVQSGLVGDATYVRPTRLAVHFVLAMILACYVLWMALNILYNNDHKYHHIKIRNSFIVIAVLILIQFIFGALLAGHKAATVAATWPTINGDWIPTNMMNDKDGHPILNNKITIHFIHRTIAYLIFIAVCIVTYYIGRVKGKTKKYKYWSIYPLVFVITQVLLGIYTVVMSTKIQQNQWGVFESLALMHQFIGMMLLLSVVIMINISYKKPV